VTENRVLRICGPSRNGVTAGWRKLSNLYSSPFIIRMIKSKEDEMGRACSTNGGEEEYIKAIRGKARGKQSTTKTKKWMHGLD
jgi:hypothetical protein